MKSTGSRLIVGQSENGEHSKTESGPDRQAVRLSAVARVARLSARAARLRAIAPTPQQEQQDSLEELLDWEP